VLKAAVTAYAIVSAISTSTSSTQDLVFINDVIVHNFISQAIISFFKLIDEYLNL
jgi:hypothetical protein